MRRFWAVCLTLTYIEAALLGYVYAAKPQPVSIDRLEEIPMAGKALRLVVRTPFHAKNRWLHWSLESGSGEGEGSSEQMYCYAPDEPQGPGWCKQIRTVHLRPVGQGRYVFVAHLVRENGEEFWAYLPLCYRGFDVKC